MVAYLGDTGRYKVRRMTKGHSKHFRGRLSASEIAIGMNAASRNAMRLLDDASLLFEKQRYPTAVSLAVLAIEEAGKLSILRGLSIAPNNNVLAEEWKNYRKHTAKNVAWIIGDLAAQGAKTLNDLRPIFDRNSDHGTVLDTIKQIGFYTDCYANGHWSEPQEVIDHELALSILSVAKILCRGRETSEREIQLWIHHLAEHWGTPDMRLACLRFHQALVEEGLTKNDLEEMREFLGLL